MAILTTILDDPFSRQADRPQRCFVCDLQLDLPAVYWAGCNGNEGLNNGLAIWMHPQCAWNLGKNLIQDAHKLLRED